MNRLVSEIYINRLKERNACWCTPFRDNNSLQTRIIMKLTALPLLTGVVVITVVLTTWYMNKKDIINLSIIDSPASYMHVPKRRSDTQISYTADSLPSWDFTRLINMSGFTFLLENSICNETIIDILIVVHTAPKNLDRRNAIRETWGQPRKGLRLIFLLGGVDNQTLQNNLDSEDRKHHDLVQGNFHDAYKNMTYKHIMAFKYVVYYCPNVKYILKTDDDLLVNMPHVMDYMQNETNFPKEGKKDLILCALMDGSPAIRTPSKWFVPFAEYPHSSYPVYCSGYAIIYSYDVAFRLYREGQRGEYLWVDDAFVSGVLAQRINVKHKWYPKGFILNWKTMEKFVKSNGMDGPDDFWYGPVNIDSRKVREIWSAIISRMMSKEANKTLITPPPVR